MQRGGKFPHTTGCDRGSPANRDSSHQRKETIPLEPHQLYATMHIADPLSNL